MLNIEPGFPETANDLVFSCFLLKTDNTSITTANKADLQEVLETDYDTGTNEVSYMHSLTVIICFTKANAFSVSTPGRELDCGTLYCRTL